MKSILAGLFFVLALNSCSGIAVEKTFLVSLRKAEFLSIVDCVSKSRDPVLCAAYGVCEKELPPRVFAAHQKCQKEHVGHEVLRCTRHAPLFKNLEIPAKIFDCIVDVLHVLTPEEKKIMIKFEECAKKLQKESCKLVESHHHAHRVHHHHGK